MRNGGHNQDIRVDAILTARPARRNFDGSQPKNRSDRRESSEIFPTCMWLATDRCGESDRPFFLFRCQRISPENRYVLASCETASNEATIAKGYRNVNFFVGRIRRVRSSRLRTYRCSPLQYVRVPTRPHLGSVL